MSSRETPSLWAWSKWCRKQGSQLAAMAAPMATNSVVASVMSVGVWDMMSSFQPLRRDRKPDGYGVQAADVMTALFSIAPAACGARPGPRGSAPGAGRGTGSDPRWRDPEWANGGASPGPGRPGRLLPCKG